MKLYPLLFEQTRGVKRTPQPTLTGKTATIDEVQQHFTHFHLSRIFLGEPTFQFTPRVPSEPYIDMEGNVIEDNFTKRISLAADIEDARDAIKDYGGTYYYIYATQKTKDIEAVESNLPNCPKDPPAEYGEKFNMRKWLKKNEPQELPRLKAIRGHDINIAPHVLAPAIKQQFKGCVPDSNETHEEWSTKPLGMVFIGTIGEAGDVVELSETGADIMGL